jgi:hypothetical protein
MHSDILIHHAHAVNTERLRNVRPKPRKQVYTIWLMFPNNTSRSVKVKAASREVAERRALKRNPGASGVKRDA